MFRNRIVVLVIVLGMLIMTVPPFVPNLPLAGGTVTKLANGDLIVDGSTHTIDMNGQYQHDGNITVKGSAGKLIIRDTEFIIKTPNYVRNIFVKDGGKLILDNSTITVNLDTFNFRESLNIEVTNGGIWDMESSNLECDGTLKVNNGYVYVRNSTITSNENDVGNNDTCVDIRLEASSYMLMYDSAINSMPKLDYIEVGGTSTFVAINSFLDIDFEKNDYSQLRLGNSGTAYLYGVTTVTPSKFPPWTSAIIVPGSTAKCEIYKWAQLSVLDAADIPVGGAKVTVQDFTESSPIDVPRSEILGYLGKTTSDWNITGVDGLVTIPLMTNLLTYGTPTPVNNYTGTYNITSQLASFAGTAYGGISFTSYPRMLAEENAVEANITYENKIVPPHLNKHYSTDTPLTITGTTTFKSPIQIQENIIINGGTLILDGAEFKYAQSAKHRFYLTLKNNGKLLIKNSVLYDKTDIKFTIYNFDCLVNITESLLDDIGAIAMPATGEINIVSSQINGNFYVNNDQVKISIMNGSMINGSSVIMNKANVMMHDASINATDSISVDDVTLTAVNSTFSKPLNFNGNTVAELVNVKISGSINVEDNAIVYRSWWLTTNVSDAGDNPVEGALVNVYNYSLPHGILIIYSNGTTDSYGQTIIKVVGEIINATDTYTGIERSYFVEAEFKDLTSTSTGFTSPTSNIKKFVTFSQMPDLTPTEIKVIGDRTEGKKLKFNATIKNEGNFEARDILVKFMMGTQQIGSDMIIPFLDIDETTSLEVEWEAKIGNYMLKVNVDPMNTVGEMNELNNNITTDVKIETGAPDIYIYPENIVFNPTEPTKEQLVNITVAVGNDGDSDPLIFGNPVSVKIFLGDPDEDGEQLGNTTTIHSIEPYEFKNAYAEHTFDDVAKYSIYATAETDLDLYTLNNRASADLDVYNFADLVLNPVNIDFKPGSEVAKNAKTTIIAKVVNNGDSNAYDVQVDFYTNDPTGPSSTHLGTETADVITRYGSEDVEFEHVFDEAGSYNIYIVVDSPNATRELNELNNMGNKTIKVLSEPDLYVNPAYITFHSSKANHIVQGETITIMAAVDNIGETAVTDEFIVHFFYKSATSDNLVGTEIITGLDADDNVSVQTTFVALDIGTHNILVWADRVSIVTDLNPDNNMGVKDFRVYSKPDLTMDPEDLSTDITVTPLEVPYSKLVTIRATVRNVGETDSNSFWVQFFDGDPEKGGIQVGLNKRISAIASGETKTVEVQWSAKPGGKHSIYAVADPFNEVIEHNESNNFESLGIYVMTVPDLMLTSDDIVFSSGDYGRINQEIIINATIHNKGDTDSDDFTVTFYIGDPIHDVAFTKLREVIVEGIPGGANRTVEADFTPYTFGKQRIYIWIDEADELFELSDANNVAGRIYEVLEIAPDLVIGASDIKIMKDSTVVSSIHTNTDYEINITIRNEGNEDVEVFSVMVTYLHEDGTTETIGPDHNEVEEIQAAGTAKLILDWSTSLKSDVSFSVWLDSMEEYPEFSEDNNSYTTSFYPVIIPPDIKVKDIANDVEVTSPPPRVGDSISMTVKVTVTGDLSSKTVLVTVKVDDEVVGSENLGFPQTGGERTNTTGEFTWTAGAEGFADVKIVVDPNDVEDETDENNEFTYDAIYITAKKKADEAEGISPMILIVLIIVIVVVVALAVFIIMRKRKKKGPIECQECGAMVEDIEATECPECGAAIIPPPEPVTCAKCKAEITTADETCPECGESNEEYVPPMKPIGEDEEPRPAGEEEEQPPAAAAAAPAAAPAAPAAAPAPKEKKKKAKAKKKKVAPAPAPGPAPAPSPAPMPSPEPMAAPAPAVEGMAEIEGIEDMLADEGEGEAECYKCGARVPLSVPSCPVCGADFE